MKKFSLIYFLLFAFLFSFSSCSIFNIANSTIEPIVFTKPVYRDSSSLTSYVGAKYNKTEYLSEYVDMVDNSFGQVHWFQTQIHKNYNYSYGAFGYLGSIGIEDNGQKDYKNFGGAGISADMQLNLPFTGINLRPFGVRTSLLYEGGEYSRYKSQLSSGMGDYADKIAVTLSQTAGIDFKFRKSALAVNFSVGSLMTFPHAFMDLIYSTNVNYNFSRFTVFVQSSGALVMSNEDLVVGLNYRLP